MNLYLYGIHSQSKKTLNNLPSKNTGIIDMKDIQFVWKALQKNWYVPLISVAILFGIGYLYSYKLTNMYAAKTQILLKSGANVNAASVISENFYGNTGQSFIDNSNEIRVIQSYDLVKKALDRLDFDVSYFLVGRIRTSEMFEGIPFKVKSFNINPALFEQQMRFKILDLEHYELYYLKAGKEEKRSGLFNKELTETDFHLLVTRGDLMTKNSIDEIKILEYLVQIHNHEGMVYKFQSSMDIKNPEYTNVLEVSLEDVIPERAVVFLDTLAKVYIENTVKTRLELNDNTLKYIDRQMGEVSGILNNIEDTMQGYKEKHSILDLDKEGADYFNKFQKYDGTRSELNLQISALNDLENYIISGKDPELLPPSVYIVKEDGFLQRAVSELYTMQLNRTTALSTSKESSPAIVEQDKRIEALKKNLLIYIGNQRVALKQRMNDIDKEINSYVADIRGLPVKQRGLVNIQRKLTVNESMYLFLLQRRSNTVIAKASIIPETKIIESARSMGVVKPDRKKIIVSFISFGVIVSLLIIVIRSTMFARIESVEELKGKTQLPVIGEVIYAPTIKELIIAAESEPKSQIAEAFRTIRTNLQYMTTTGHCKTIVITSNSPGEGKTFCTLNLAGILAKASKKVLVLELDLHKPRIQKGLNLEADIGISTIVIGKNTIEECVKHTIIENLDTILSGPLPPNPSEIVLSKELEDIIHYGKQHYDYVLIDTPPVGLISDAIVLMKLADVNLFVINTKFPFKDSLENAHEIVGMNKLIHFGFILNGVKRRKSKYYYNRYAYGYGGYGSYGAYGSYGGGYGNYGEGSKKS
jgi:capsular exopolysaccharide synthesis family protein